MAIKYSLLVIML